MSLGVVRILSWRRWRRQQDTCGHRQDSAGRECGRGMAGSSNQEAVGHEQAVAAVHTAIGLAVAAAGVEMPLRAAWLGLAGVDHVYDIDALLPQVHSIASMVRITNDAELVLGALPGASGSL